ncbi:MAG: hypothetical protein AYK18_05880 [Theionarchaea archaeon DG-70]|nr:MAG: hypothetical protein AYK18_05880 [Theionarchaea archaeon DG-70]
MIQVTPIGFVKNGMTKTPEKWSDTQSEIHIYPEFREALCGLEKFSHIVVVFYFHLSSVSPLKVHPRGRSDLPLVGVFSTRAPVRPNPIGVSVVELLAVEGTVLTVKGLEAFDETPILDIKPHLSDISPHKVADWVYR